jgi:hypothetical protein
MAGNQNKRAFCISPEERNMDAKKYFGDRPEILGTLSVFICNEAGTTWFHFRSGNKDLIA